jgi:hypothetical protein
MDLKDAVLMKGWYLLRKEKMRLCGLQKRPAVFSVSSSRLS